MAGKFSPDAASGGFSAELAQAAGHTYRYRAWRITVG